MKNNRHFISYCLTAGLLLFSNIGFVTNPIPVSASENREYNGNRYQIINQSMNWENAKKYCEESGGHLVTIGDSGEQKFVESLLDTGEKNAYWLGLSAEGTDWNWVDGTPLSYVRWDNNQPDNYYGNDYYGIIYGYSAQYDGWGVNKAFWNDIPLEGDPGDNEGALKLQDIGFICEWENSQDTKPVMKDVEPTDVTVTEPSVVQEAADHEESSFEVSDILNRLSLEEKAAQMVQPAIYHVSEAQMEEHCYGSILSLDEALTFKEWQGVVDGYQSKSLNSNAGIPYLYGQDDVHGVNYCSGAVIFPHNIGMGAANDSDLIYRMGLATANEAMLCHMIWNFSPCVAVSEDPRWGRTYESYGANLSRIGSLSTSYTKGLIDGGMVACAKHFFGDGNVEYGTGECSDTYRIMDRGDAQVNDAEIDQLLSVYQQLIDAGVQTIMVSHSSVNGVKMHENEQYLQYLKNDMGFKGFLISDWDSVQNTSASTYEDQVINCVNAGVDMLMEVERFEEARQIIVRAVSDGRIPMSRVDDAVSRIIKVKLDAGIFDDPYFEQINMPQTITGSAAYRGLAEEAVEKSLVLLKNDGQILPFRKGMTIYVAGPAMDDGRVQCGGWTLAWNESPTDQIPGCTTILDGLKSRESAFGIEIITDPAQASRADAVLLVLGEQSYAEWHGDTEDLSIFGEKALSENYSAFQNAVALGKPIVTCIVAGRQVLLEEVYEKSDSVVMCYLLGSEGRGVADVLCGNTNFSGTLPSPWYSSLEQIGSGNSWLDIGFGLKY